MLRKIIVCSIMILAVGFSQGLYKAGGDARLAPRLLNYQGYLTDTLGNPITNPSLSMIFSIFDAATVGNQKWTETQPAVSVNKGIFHVLLGTVTPIPDSVFNANANRWLEMAVAGQILAPRTRITSAPYAYTATYSDTATYARTGAADNDWIISGSNMYSAVSGNIGIGTPTPAYKLDVNGILCAGTSNTVASDFGAVLGGTNNRAGEDANNSVLVVGGNNNYALHDFSTIVGGRDNYSENPYTFIGGGYRNYIVAEGATVAGGEYDTILGIYGSVLGGYSNKAGDAYADTAAAVTAGYDNVATGKYSFVGAGRSDTASGDYAAVAGGYSNIASASYSTVAGGYNNTANQGYATVGGGYINTASGANATVAGGYSNTASNQDAAVGGGVSNVASGSRACVGGGYVNTASGQSSTVSGGYQNVAGADYSVVTGGYQDTVRAPYGGVLSGNNNLAGDGLADSFVVVAGGYNNDAHGNYSNINGGRNNTTWGLYSVVGGGSGNNASVDYGTIAGGGANYASNAGSVGGGLYNNANGSYAVVPGGYGDTVSAAYSMAGGYRVRLRGTATYSFGYGSDFVVDSPSVAVFHNPAKAYKVGIGTSNPQANLDLNGNLRVTNGAFYGNVGPANGAPFPRPAYQTAWIRLPTAGSGLDTLRIVHNIGGDINDYVVDLQQKDTLWYGITNRGQGMDASSSSLWGAWWGNLTSTSITVYKYPSAYCADSMRVRIWVIK